jgi:hypothetical protein
MMINPERKKCQMSCWQSFGYESHAQKASLFRKVFFLEATGQLLHPNQTLHPSRALGDACANCSEHKTSGHNLRQDNDNLCDGRVVDINSRPVCYENDILLLLFGAYVGGA